jgi:heptosyltransferase-2
MDKLDKSRILLVKNRALGDSILTLSSLNFLKSALPSSEIYLGVPEWIAPLYKDIELNSKEVISFEFSSIKKWYQNYKKIKSLKLDYVIELNQSGSSSKFFKIFCALNNCKYFFHNHHDKKGRFIRNQGIRKPNIQRDLDACWSILKKLDIEVEVPDYLDYPPILNYENIKNSDLICLGVVATRRTKMWPLSYYLELCQAREFKDKLIIIPLSNSVIDSKIEEYFLKKGLPENVEIIKAPLSELILSLSPVDLYIGNDTGLKHLCAALGSKTITFFGPEEPLEWHPYNLSKHKYLFVKNLECRTLISHFCALKTCDSMICLNEFKVEHVIQKLKEFNI